MALYPLDLNEAIQQATGSDTSSTTVLAVTTVEPVRALAANPDRTSFLIVNTSAQNTFWGFTSQVSSAVYTFAVPKNSYFEFATTYPWVGEVWAIANGACNVTVTEISK